MYTTIRLKTTPHILHDKYPTANTRPRTETIERPVVPLEYRRLHTHVSTQVVPRNTTTSFELFPLLDEKTQANIRSLTYIQRKNVYQNLADLINSWCGYSAYVTHGEIRNGTRYTIEGGPIVMLTGVEVPLNQIIREKIRELYARLMPSK